nr:hypothetical protein ECPA41_5014 [Escherichia coli PA41]
MSATMLSSVGGGAEKGPNEKWIIPIIKAMAPNSMPNELILFCAMIPI